MEALVTTNYWRGRRVLVTGHTGFKGAWLVALMHKLGAEVAGYSLDPPTTPSLFEQIAGAQMCADHRGDIRDVARMSGVFRDFGPEHIFHLAAQPIVLAAREHGIETVDTNVRGTACVLDVARTTPSIRSIVSVTTDKVYRNSEWSWPYRETDALGGHEPYGASKACAEIITEAWAHSFLEPLGMHTACARAGNVIGGGDWAHARLIPDFIRAWSSDRTLTIRSPNSIRPWQHVLEPLSGYVAYAQALAEHPLGLPRALNFGPRLEDAQSVVRVCALANRVVGGVVNVNVVGSDPKFESSTLRLDSSLANSALGWKPKLNLEQAISWTVGWYRDVSEGGNARQSCLNQISEFLELC